MNRPKGSSEKTKMNESTSSIQSEIRIKIRTLTPMEARAELSLRARRIEAAIAQLEKAQIVTHDTLQLEFKI